MMAVLPKIIHILGGYYVIVLDSDRELDKEWVELIMEALDLGISVEEIQHFLKNN